MSKTTQHESTAAVAPVNAGRKQGRFQPGVSGNPRGKPKGARNGTTIAAQTLLAGEAEALTRKAVELALAGDIQALRMCLDRILPAARAPGPTLDLPALDTSSAAKSAAHSAVLAAVAEGKLDPDQGETVGRLIDAAVAALREKSSVAPKVNRNTDLSAYCR